MTQLLTSERPTFKYTQITLDTISISSLLPLLGMGILKTSFSGITTQVTYSENANELLTLAWMCQKS